MEQLSPKNSLPKMEQGSSEIHTTQPEPFKEKSKVNADKPPPEINHENRRKLLIEAPKNLDYSNYCIIQWYAKEGDVIEIGEKIFSIEESLALEKNRKTFTLIADKEYVLWKRNFYKENNSKVIPNKDAVICELLLKNEEKGLDKGNNDQENEVQPNKAVSSTTTNQRKRKNKKQIETDLSKLKELREKGLITEEVWTEKQKEILKDY